MELPRRRTLLLRLRTVSGTFLERTNRFLARVGIRGEVHDALLRNTGRIQELQRGTEVFCLPKEGGKTSLILVGCVVNGGVTLLDPVLQSLSFEEAARRKGLDTLAGELENLEKRGQNEGFEIGF